PAVPGRLSQQCLRRASRIHQSLEALGVQRRPRAVPRRQTCRSARGFPDRLHRARRRREGRLGTTGRAARDARRIAARLRRRRQPHLAGELQTTIVLKKRTSKAPIWGSIAPKSNNFRRICSEREQYAILAISLIKISY